MCTGTHVSWAKPMLTPPTRAAFVLSGGGALAAAQLGAAQVLYERGFTFDWFAGVSGGAIAGALLASGLSPEESWRRLLETKIFSLFLESSGRLSIFRGQNITKALREAFDGVTFETLPHPLYIFATDFGTGQQRKLSTGSVGDAVRASVSVPGLLEPFYDESTGSYLVDGGLVDNFPVRFALEHYPGTIIGIDVATVLRPAAEIAKSRILFRRSRGLFRALNQTVRIMLLAQQQGIPHDPRLHIIRPPLGHFTAFDVLRIQKIYDVGRQAAEDFLTSTGTPQS